MIMRHKILLVTLALAVAGGAGATLWWQGYLGGERALWRLIKTQPELVKSYQEARASEAKIRQDPGRASLYFNVGLAWKSVGELADGSIQSAFFKKALSTYQEGVKRFGDKNILFYLNAGHLAERLEEYALAEEYYRQAITISPGDESPYLDLAALYEYRLGKPKAEILPIFEAGMKRMLNPAALLGARAGFLKRIGDYAAALEDYEALLQAFPNNSGYRAVIAELQLKLGEKK